MYSTANEIDAAIICGNGCRLLEDYTSDWDHYFIVLVWLLRRPCITIKLSSEHNYSDIFDTSDCQATTYFSVGFRYG